MTVPLLTVVSYVVGPFWVVVELTSCAQTPVDTTAQPNVHSAARKMDIRLLFKYAFAIFSSYGFGRALWPAASCESARKDAETIYRSGALPTK